jgi:hypothetical protein
MNTDRELLYFIDRNSYYGNTVSKEAMNAMHRLLYTLETVQHLASCVEIMDLNKLKIIRKQHLKEQVLRQPFLKPFQFVNNRN